MARGRGYGCRGFHPHPSPLPSRERGLDVGGTVVAWKGSSEMGVHSGVGYGFREVGYQWASGIEMWRVGISFSREHEMPIYYRREQVGTRPVDFLVVESKAVSRLDNSHLHRG